MSGNLTRDARRVRDELETAQTMLMSCAVDLDEVALRVRQAMRRTPLVVDVLQPALARIDRIHGDLVQSQACLSGVWSVEQKKKWKE